jgi:hypothetical protein
MKLESFIALTATVILGVDTIVVWGHLMPIRSVC